MKNSSIGMRLGSVFILLLLFAVTAIGVWRMNSASQMQEQALQLARLVATFKLEAPPAVPVRGPGSHARALAA